MTVVRKFLAPALRALALVAMAAAVEARAAAPLEAYGGLPNIESVEISPDGTKAAVAISTGEQRLLGIKTLPDGQMRTYAVGAAKVRRLDWVGSDRVIITTSQTSTVIGVYGPRGERFLGF